MDYLELARLASGHVEARIIQTSVQLGVFDCLRSQPLSAPAIAASLGTNRRATDLLLNALVALSLVRKERDRFSLAPISQTYLVKGMPRYLGEMILFDASLWHCWQHLNEALRTGTPVHPPDMYQDDPEETERFIMAMDSLVKARGDAEVLAQVIDWSRIEELLDIGSGPATYPIHLCRRHSNLRAVIFDLPNTLRITDRLVREARMGERIRLIAGDYRTDPIPGSYPIVFLSNIIHAEGPEVNERLMAKLYPRVADGGKIIIKDHILEESRTDPAVGAIFSLLMLLTTASGRCYALNEVQTWLQRAGFKRVTQTRLPPPLTSALVIGEK